MRQSWYPERSAAIDKRKSYTMCEVHNSTKYAHRSITSPGNLISLKAERP